MRVVFLGSGRFAIPSLEALLGAGHELAHKVVAHLALPAMTSNAMRNIPAIPPSTNASTIHQVTTATH